jgi:hypothetical protein
MIKVPNEIQHKYSDILHKTHVQLKFEEKMFAYKVWTYKLTCYKLILYMNND